MCARSEGEALAGVIRRYGCEPNGVCLAYRSCGAISARLGPSVGEQKRLAARGARVLKWRSAIHLFAKRCCGIDALLCWVQCYNEHQLLVLCSENTGSA